MILLGNLSLTTTGKPYPQTEQHRFKIIISLCLDGRRWSRFGFWAIGALICAEILGVFHWTCIVHCILCFWGAGYLYDFRSWPEKQMLSTHSKVIFIKSRTFCSRINFSKNDNLDNVHPEGRRKVIICSTNFHHNLHKIWCALKVSGGVGLAFGPEPLSLSQSMGQWERLHSATFTFCQAFCSTAMPFILNLHVFMSEAPTIHSSLACDLIHTQKKISQTVMTKLDGWYWSFKNKYREIFPLPWSCYLRHSVLLS